MLELMASLYLDELWSMARPLLLPFLTGTLTPVLCCRAFWPLLCWTGRGLRSAGRKVAAACRSKPNPQMALMQATLERLVGIWNVPPAAPPPSPKAGPW